MVTHMESNPNYPIRDLFPRSWDGYFPYRGILSNSKPFICELFKLPIWNSIFSLEFVLIMYSYHYSLMQWNFIHLSIFSLLLRLILSSQFLLYFCNSRNILVKYCFVIYITCVNSNMVSKHKLYVLGFFQ